MATATAPAGVRKAVKVPEVRARVPELSPRRAREPICALARVMVPTRAVKNVRTLGFIVKAAKEMIYISYWMKLVSVT
jgi:hypothetical protein